MRTEGCADRGDDACHQTSARAAHRTFPQLGLRVLRGWKENAGGTVGAPNLRNE
jgi:hypothetical protein